MIKNDWNELKRISKDAYDWLSKFDANEYGNGRHELDNGIYCNIERYKTVSRTNRRFESHNKYIDIQYIIQGEEIISIADTKKLSIASEYDETKDIIFYNDAVKYDDILMTTGDFMVLYPNDAHMPCISDNGIAIEVRKAVIKVPISLIEHIDTTLIYK